MKTETAIYRNKSKQILITESRAVIQSKTIVMANVTSIVVRRKPPNYAWGALVIMAGFILLVSNIYNGVPILREQILLDTLAFTLAGVIMGFLIIVGGLVMISRAKSTYSILLSTAAGEIAVLSSEDKNFVSEVALALNKAVAQKG